MLQIVGWRPLRLLLAVHSAPLDTYLAYRICHPYCSASSARTDFNLTGCIIFYVYNPLLLLLTGLQNSSSKSPVLLEVTCGAPASPCGSFHSHTHSESLDRLLMVTSSCNEAYTAYTSPLPQRRIFFHVSLHLQDTWPGDGETGFAPPIQYACIRNQCSNGIGLNFLRKRCYLSFSKRTHNRTSSLHVPPCTLLEMRMYMPCHVHLFKAHSVCKRCTMPSTSSPALSLLWHNSTAASSRVGRHCHNSWSVTREYSYWRASGHMRNRSD